MWGVVLPRHVQREYTCIVCVHDQAGLLRDRAAYLLAHMRLGLRRYHAACVHTQTGLLYDRAVYSRACAGSRRRSSGPDFGCAHSGWRGPAAVPYYASWDSGQSGRTVSTLKQVLQQLR